MSEQSEQVDRYPGACGPQFDDPESLAEAETAASVGEPPVAIGVGDRATGLAAALLASDAATLQDEIRALRLALAKSLLEVHDPVRLATDVPRIASVLVRATQVNKILAAGESEFAKALDEVFRDLGLDEEEE